MADSMSRFARSWLLIKASMDVLRNDNALLVLPAISSVVTLVVAGGFVALAMSNGTFAAMHATHRHGSVPLEFYVWMFCLYVVQYFVVIFFNTALIGCAIVLLGGGHPTVWDGLKLAVSRIGAILGYAIISATVGVLLQVVAEKLGFVGRLIAGGLGLAWTAATFLVVPILAAEGVGPMASGRTIKRAVAQDLGRELDRQCRHFAGDVDDLRHHRVRWFWRRVPPVQARLRGTRCCAHFRRGHRFPFGGAGQCRARRDLFRGGVLVCRQRETAGGFRRRFDFGRLHAQGRVVPGLFCQLPFRLRVLGAAWYNVPASGITATDERHRS